MKIWGLVGLLICIIFSPVAVVKSQSNQLESNFGTMIPSASFYGKEYNERIGYALAGAGDVNGDGFDDFMIGTFHNSVIGSDAGAVYLFLGHTYLRWGLNDTVSNADARFLGQQAYDAAGYSVACNGDLNGDGFDDIIIGAPAGNDNVPHMSGRVYIVFGKKQANWGFYNLLYDSCDVIYEGEGNQDLVGLSVAYVGDLNGDGFDDFLISAPFRDGNYENMGKVYLILGRAEPWLKVDYLTYADAGFIYERDGAETGYSIAGVGDVNDDGIPDFAIGAFGVSRVFVIYGRTSVDWGKNFNLEDADLILYGEEPWVNEGMGWKVAGSGDLNSDGIDDIVVSAIFDNGAATLSGKVYILFGRHGGWNDQVLALKNGDASYIGEQATDQAGWGLAIAGDVDSDGFDDIMVGTYKDNNGPVDGKAYLIKGKATGWKMNVPLSTVSNYCERDPSGIGYTVSSAGDFDNDGIPDYIISAPFNSDIQHWNGKVYLFASQQIPYEISGKVTYYQSGKSIPEAIVWADTMATAIDTTNSTGSYQIFVRGKHDHTVHIQKERNSYIGNSITSYDAALIARLAINLDTPDTINTQAVDVNLDGHINMYDAANTLRCAVALPPLADSYTGEWVFIPNSMNYDSVVIPYFNQNYVGFVRGDVDISWQSPGAGLMKPNLIENPIPTEMAVKDDEVILPILYDMKTPLISFDLDIKYNQQKMKFVKIERTQLTSGFQLAYNCELNNQLKIGGFNPNPIATPGTLLLIIFKLTDSNHGNTQLNIERFQVNNFSVTTTTVNAIIGDECVLHAKFELYQNYPNPFNSTTTIPFYVSEQGHTKFVIYNLIGEEIKILFDEIARPGKYQLTWDGKDKAGYQAVSGVYICKVFHHTGNKKIKIIYMK